MNNHAPTTAGIYKPNIYKEPFLNKQRKYTKGMPRNRMIKPEFWNDEKLGKESEAIQLTYIGTWNFSDDYGVVRANPVWLKNQLFPYKDNLRLEAFSKWLEALERMEMLIKFTVRGEQYYFIRTFRLYQSVEKPSKTRNCNEDELIKALESLGFIKQSDNRWKKVDEQSGSSRVVVDAEEKLSINGKENKRANALAVSDETSDARQKDLKSKFDELVKTITGSELKTVVQALKGFITDHRPEFIQPYFEYWNLFAPNYNLSKITSATDARKKKFKTRICEMEFDFLKIMDKIKTSPHLKGDNSHGWKVSFDWIFENQSNYIKIMEGNYD